MRSVRRRADDLGLDHRHFTGQRRWTDDQLVKAVRASRSWAQVAEALGLTGGSGPVTIKAHAIRLDLDTRHFEAKGTATPVALPCLDPRTSNLPRAGSMLAAAWFTLCGYDVSWPLEPCRYDLLVVLDRPARIQVKTASVRTGETCVVWLSSTGPERRIYDPDDIDYFFVIDVELNYYLIPVSVVGGFHAIHLSTYAHYRLPTVSK